MNKCFGLVRVSSEKQSTNTSLQHQRNSIEKYCAGQGKFMFGDQLTIADFWVGGLYVNNFINPHCAFGKD